MEIDADRYLTRSEIAALAHEMGLHIAKSTIEKKAMVGSGPKAAGKVGTRHLYRRADVLAWLRSLVQPIEGGR